MGGFGSWRPDRARYVVVVVVVVLKFYMLPVLCIYHFSHVPVGKGC